MADTSQRAFMIERIDRMGCILDYQQVMLLSQSHNSIHITGDTSIVNHHDDTRLLVDQWFNSLHSDVRIILSAIGKADKGTLTQEGNSRRDKGVRGYNHLITWLQFTEHGTHLKGISTRCSKQTLAETIAFLKKTMTQLGELSVARHCR